VLPAAVAGVCLQVDTTAYVFYFMRYCKTLEFGYPKIYDFTRKITLTPIILANLKHEIPTKHTIPIKAGVVLIYAPSNFMFYLACKICKIKGMQT